jgi:hypothetical protein
MRMGELPCIRCGRETKAAIEGDDAAENPPDEALLFVTYGNYGSAVYDPVDDSQYLMVVICDSCVLDAAGKGIVLHCRQWKRPKTERETWDPGKG